MEALITGVLVAQGLLAVSLIVYVGLWIKDRWL